MAATPNQTKKNRALRGSRRWGALVRPCQAPGGWDTAGLGDALRAGRAQHQDARRVPTGSGCGWAGLWPSPGHISRPNPVPVAGKQALRRVGAEPRGRQDGSPSWAKGRGCPGATQDQSIAVGRRRAGCTRPSGWDPAFPQSVSRAPVTGSPRLSPGVQPGLPGRGRRPRAPRLRPGPAASAGLPSRPADSPSALEAHFGPVPGARRWGVIPGSGASSPAWLCERRLRLLPWPLGLPAPGLPLPVAFGRGSLRLALSGSGQRSLKCRCALTASLQRPLAHLHPGRWLAAEAW